MSAAKADDAVARALITKQNPVIVQAVDAAKMQGKAEAIVAVLCARALEPTEAQRARILCSKDPTEIDAWLTTAATCTEVDELFR